MFWPAWSLVVSKLTDQDDPFHFSASRPPLSVVDCQEVPFQSERAGDAGDGGRADGRRLQ
jgi:hypothetical protein